MEIILNRTLKTNSYNIKLSDLLMVEEGYIEFNFYEFGSVEFEVKRIGVEYGKKTKDR